MTPGEGNGGNGSGILRGIAMRPDKGDPMQELTECELQAGHGLACENRNRGNRQATLLAVESWRDTCNDLGAPLPWTTRRANLLVEGVPLAAKLDDQIRIGDVVLRVHKETKPCGLMDTLHSGLRKALEPAFRGGVVAEVVRGGVIRVGDAVH